MKAKARKIKTGGQINLAECARLNSNRPCHREMNGHSLCDGCPKVKHNKFRPALR